MTYAAVYRSTHPDVIDHYRRFDTERRAWSVAVDDLWREAGFPDGTKVWVGGGWPFGGDWIAGLELPEGGAAPKGWVASRDRQGRYLPSRASKVGREAQARVDAIGKAPALTAVLTEHGMPTFIDADLRWTNPAFAAHGTPTAEVWVGWSVDPDAVALDREARGYSAEKIRVDAEHWERVALSDFYARVEGGDPPLPMGGDD